MLATYSAPRDHDDSLVGFAAIGVCQGVFALFTMYLPPLFPTLLRTTGAGFCYNIGRIAAGFGTVFFGLFSQVGDYRLGAVLRRLPVPAGRRRRLAAARNRRTKNPLQTVTASCC